MEIYIIALQSPIGLSAHSRAYQMVNQRAVALNFRQFCKQAKSAQLKSIFLINVGMEREEEMIRPELKIF